MSMALEVMNLIFAVLDVSFNSGYYTVIIKQQFLYINNNNKSLGSVLWSSPTGQMHSKQSTWEKPGILAESTAVEETQISPFQ